jgi:N-acetylmuramoyl-L-alanine amidase
MNKIIIHCSDTFTDMNTTAADIDRWHRERGWASIGYHYVIKRDGTVEQGRPENVPGAHVAGHNTGSIGICLIGGKARGRENPCNFTRHQWRALESLVMQLAIEYPQAEILGHTDLDPGKSCPTFNVKAWWGDR